MRRFQIFSFLLFQLSIFSFGAILPHQGRVLISGSAFEGTGLFRFALVVQSGAVVWNHEGGVGDPQNSLSIPVEKGFYQCRLGDTSTQGMAPLPDTIFTPENPLKLRIWFDDGTNGLQRLGQDQNLMMAPYAMTSPRSESEKIAMRFADEIIRQAGTTNISVDELIARISSFAQQATQQGTITKDMLPIDLFAEMNKTVQMFHDSQSMIADLNSSLNQALIAIDRPITRDMLPESVRKDLNRTISKSMLGADVLADLNRSKKVSVDLLEDGAVSTAKLDPIILKYLKPEIRNQPLANAVVAGNDLNITVNAEGKYLTFQWQKDGVDLPGEKNSTLSLTGYTPSVHNGKYVAVVSNDFGSVQTNPLSLNVQNSWDLNDSDNDGLTNYEEMWIYDTNPDRNDTDGDGYLDGLEISSNTDPKAFSVPGNYTREFSSFKSGNGQGGIISGNSRNQVAVSGQNGVEIYQIENNGSIRLITTIDRPSARFAKNLTLNDHFLVVDDRTVDRGMTHVYSIGSDATDFSLLASVRSAYNGAWDFGTPNEFAYGRQFVVRSEAVDQRQEGDHPSFPKDNKFWSFDIHQLELNNNVTKVMSFRHPKPEEVVGSLNNNPKGTLDAYQTMGYPLLHNGVVALPIYARFDSGEWMYVVRLSVDQNSTLSIHEPSAPGRITSMVMDNNQLIVNHTATYPEVGGFVDTFRLSDGNRTSIRNTPGSNEYLGGYASHMRLGNNGSLLYSISGAIEDLGPLQEVRPNKTISIPTPLASSSPVISLYPSSSGKFTLTNKYFVSLDNYTSQNLQNNPQNYHVVRVYPKVANLRPSPTHTVDLNSSVNLEMTWVEPGTFTMGSPVTEVGRQTDETEHNVTLTKGFYLGKYEVTQAQYEAVMTGNPQGLNPKPSWWSDKPSHPVEDIPYADIQVFLSRLSDIEELSGILPAGWKYVLPTEAQWEYACRAGTKTAYSWGDDINASRANYNNPSGQTVEVGQYDPNPWGFYDMHGNVHEWTADFHNNSSVVGVYKGGSWQAPNSSIRSAAFGADYIIGPSDKANNRGFRVSLQKQD